MSEFVRAAMAAGFTREQADFMEEFVAAAGHVHTMEDVEGLDDALDGLAFEEDED